LIRRFGALVVFALVAPACGSDSSTTDSTPSVSTIVGSAPVDSGAATIDSEVSAPAETVVDEVAQVTTIDGDVSITVTSATSAQPGTRLFAAGQPASMTAVDGDDVFFLTFAPGGLAALNRVSTATGVRAASDATWVLSGVLPIALTPDHVWALSPTDAATGVGLPHGFTVLDRITLAVVGQYDAPDGSVPISVVAVGGTAYVMTVATLTPLPNEPLDYRIRSLGADGSYGEPLAVEPPGTMISTGKFLVLTSPSATTSYQLRIIDPNALQEVGKFAVAGTGAIAGTDTTIIVPSGIYDVTDPANPVRRDAPADVPISTLTGNGRLVAIELSTDGSQFGIKVFDAASFEKTDDIEGRTPANIEVYATDGRRLCADLDSADGSIICIDLDQDSTPRAVVPTTSTVPTTTLAAPLPTVAPVSVPRAPSSVPPLSLTWNGQYVAAPPAGPLQIGHQGSRVRALQEALGEAGVLDAKYDGYFGRDTETAVIDLQRARGLPINGIAGTEVADALGLTGY